MSAVPQAPRWALFLGALGLCFGIVGVLGGVQDVALPYLVEIQKQAAERVSESLQTPAATGSENQGALEPGPWLERPHWHPAYANAMAVVRGLLGALLVFASLWLILFRPGADRLFMFATAASAVRNLVAAGVGIAAGSVLAVITVTAGLLGCLLDGALLLACHLCRRNPPAGNP